MQNLCYVLCMCVSVCICVCMCTHACTSSHMKHICVCGICVHMYSHEFVYANAQSLDEMFVCLPFCHSVPLSFEFFLNSKLLGLSQFQQVPATLLSLPPLVLDCRCEWIHAKLTIWILESKLCYLHLYRKYSFLIRFIFNFELKIYLYHFLLLFPPSNPSHVLPHFFLKFVFSFSINWSYILYIT